MVNEWTRRNVIGAAGLGAGLWVLGSARGQTAERGEEPRGKDKPQGKEDEQEVSANEDLMREHGVLERILLVYEASLARMAERDASPPSLIVRAADITRRFIEDYHEKLEEEFLFPRFQSASPFVELVRTLRVQHERGRALTDELRRIAAAGAAVATQDAARLRDTIQVFIRMYRPHAAREDTILFPAFRKLVPGKQYAELGEQFEVKEHALFGADGFQAIVEQVAELEKALGIDDLNRFTPA
jgi:hemerythrin-like domain-containing protein